MDSAEFLDILGNANRRRILRLLARKPCYVTEISEILGVSPKAVIDHLQQLEDAGLVQSRTDDRRRKYFSIARHVRLEVTVSPYEFGTKSAYPSNSCIDIASCRRLSVELDADGEDSSRPDAHPRDTSAAEGSAPDAATEDAARENDISGVATADAGEVSTEHPRSAGEDVSGRDDPATGGSSDSATAEAERASVGLRGSRVPTMARRLRELEQLDRELSMAQRWAQGRITELKTDIAEAIGLGNPGLVTDLLLLLADEPRETATLCNHLEAPPAVVEEVLEVLAADDLIEHNGGQWHLTD